MTTQQNEIQDILDTAHRILQFVGASPPHVRPWLREIEAAAQHVKLEVEAANRRASSRFTSWLDAGLLSDDEEAIR